LFIYSKRAAQPPFHSRNGVGEWVGVGGTIKFLTLS
jgi:hypothetical protein